MAEYYWMFGMPAMIFAGGFSCWMVVQLTDKRPSQIGDLFGLMFPVNLYEHHTYFPKSWVRAGFYISLSLAVLFLGVF